MRSLSRPLLIGLLLVTLATGALSAWASWQAARTEADELLDAQLAHSARSLQVLVGGLLPTTPDASAAARSVPVWDGEMRELGAAPVGARGHAYERQLVFLVWREEALLLRSENAPALSPAEVGEGFGAVLIDGAEWRTFCLHAADGLRYLAAEPIALRHHIASRIARGMLWPLLLELPLLALLIWLVVRAGSRSLRRIARAVSAQAGDALAPIERDRVPAEIHGLVDAINGLLGRVDETLRRERRFIDEAAHELRTPIAGLRLHLSNLAAADDEASRRRALAQAERGLGRLQRAVEQLLTLSRLGAAAPPPALEPVDLDRLLQQLLAEWVDGGLLAEDAVELVAAPDLRVNADAAQLGILLRNLVDNAVRHGGTPAQLRIELQAEGAEVLLAVEDQGPGIEPAERARVLDSFYRVPGSRAEGSGLGLAIVARITDLSGGRLQLGAGRDGRGLRVELRLPAAVTAARGAAPTH
jgi:two-component system sensor histidine kinase QseC